ncbi:DUF4231 domain-containing protein [Nostoc sp.]|uniref:DUF4231 domain-containing protein n=1 Tax=Nostoc sp. TaxID=1180 RepID=UPI002FF5406B
MRGGGWGWGSCTSLNREPLYRRTVESLKTQGWQFSQLTGPYRIYPSHEQAFNLLQVM